MQPDRTPVAARSSVWLNLAPDVQVEVPLADALAYGVNEFADLYQRSVYKASRHEATEWGREQVRLRAEHYRKASDAAV